MLSKKEPAVKAWQSLQRREARLLRKRRDEEQGAALTFLAEKVPPRLEDALNAAFAKAFALVFTKGDKVIGRSFSKEKQQDAFRKRAQTLAKEKNARSLRSFSNAAALSSGAHVLAAGVEGIGLGLLGIGLPDIPLFSAVLLRSVYQISLRFGFSHESDDERDFILALIAAALSRGAAFETKNRELNNWIDWGKRSGKSREMLIRDTAEALSGAMLYAKFVQGIPIVGALGGVLDSVCLSRVTQYAELKYQRRFLRQGGPTVTL